MREHRDARLWAAICAFAVILLLLVLCGISFGATGPQEYLYRAFYRSSYLSASSQMVNGTKGDKIRCFNVSLTDTTGNGVDQTYTADARYNWRFSMPDSAQICDCYEVAGSPDTLLWYHVRLPGKGFRLAANQLTTDAQGRWNPHVSIKADTLFANKRITATDAVLGAGTIGTSEIADSAITAAKIPASTITAVKIAAGAVGVSEIATDGVGAAEIAAGAVGTSEIADGTVADGDLAGSISLSKLSTASASTNDILAFNGSAWAKTSSVVAPINTSTIAASGAVTLNGAVTLGDAAGDAITSTGDLTAGGTLTATGATTLNGAVTLGDASGDAITVTGTPTVTPTLTLNGQLAAGNDSTDTATFAGAPKFTNFCKTFTYPSGVTSTTFTWTGCGTWYYFGGWQAGGGKAFATIYKSSANTLTATLATTLASNTACWICAIKP